jgi:hypothetical protein
MYVLVESGDAETRGNVLLHATSKQKKLYEAEWAGYAERKKKSTKECGRHL